MIKGIDVGGSFIKVLWQDGRKEKHYIKDIKNDKEKLIEKIKKVLTEGNPEAVGIAVAGFTSKDGTVHRSPNLPVLDGTNFTKILTELGIKGAVGNDVTLGAYGEWFFDHRDSESLLLVAVGTGLGAGLVVGGEPYFGACGSALELGHHIVQVGGEECSCGRRGCLEAYCSSYGLSRIYKKLTSQDLNDYEVIKKALKKEERALRAVEVFKEYLTVGLMNALHILNPDTLILAGGVIEAMKPLLSDLNERLTRASEELP
ncbi:MAG: ROK family protein, partial [Aquificae bacterium]|nr:ROK family protein [Aquificota bacterium]